MKILLERENTSKEPKAQQEGRGEARGANDSLPFEELPEPLTKDHLRFILDEWKKSEHPRRKDGKFGRGSGKVVETETKHDIIESEFDVMRSLSAMAKQFHVKGVKPLREEGWTLKEGSTVTKVKVIAEGRKIRDVDFLIEKNPLPNGEKTKVADWFKCRGTADVTNGETTVRNCEVHWYQCKNIGKIDFKIKKWGEEK